VTRADRVIGALLVLGGLGVAAWAWQLPGGTPQDPVGPRGFPALLGLGLAVCGAVLLVPRGRPEGSPAPGGAVVDAEGPAPTGRLVGGVALVGLYLWVLEPLGYLVSTPLFLAAVLLLQGGVPLRALLGTSLGLPAALFLLFATIMKVPLPLGVLERLSLGR
jgi:putative tricarboxylic transport membrane protein